MRLFPLLLGSGIPLVSEIGRHVDVECIDGNVYDSGVVLLSYRFER
jgi:hypothetical protein